MFLGPCTWGLSSLIGVALGVTAVVLAIRQPGKYGAQGAAVFGITLNGLLLWFLFTEPVPHPGPEMVRWRSRTARQEAVLRDVRAVLFAESLYARENGGYFDTLDCLHDAWKCVPGRRAASPLLVDTLADLRTADGYARGFIRGPVVAPERIAEAGASPSSLQSFAYVATPLETRWYKRLSERWWTSPPAFCGDDTGQICLWSHGRPGSARGGRCPAGGDPALFGLRECGRD